MMANIRTYVSFKGLYSLLKSPLSGGGVIPIPKQWSFDDLMDAFRLGLFLVKRFIHVFCKEKIETVVRK